MSITLVLRSWDNRGITESLKSLPEKQILVICPLASTSTSTPRLANRWTLSSVRVDSNQRRLPQCGHVASPNVLGVIHTFLPHTEHSEGKPSVVCDDVFILCV